jgi:CspA family cold shock protein
MSSDNGFDTTRRYTGRVKWFNNKAGYGFITITDGLDIFVHHSAICVENQYKYLVLGEYVEFNLTNTTSEKHKFQASLVNGINGGKLMCQTRNELKQYRNAYRAEHPKLSRQSSEVSEKEDWNMVSKKTTSTRKPRQRGPPKEVRSK